MEDIKNDDINQEVEETNSEFKKEILELREDFNKQKLEYDNLIKEKDDKIADLISIVKQTQSQKPLSLRERTDDSLTEDEYVQKYAEIVAETLNSKRHKI